jgi:hypothetical protein
MSTSVCALKGCGIAAAAFIVALGWSWQAELLLAQQGCELVATRPTLIEPLRMFGEGGRTCSRPASAERVRVRLRQDRRFWPDPTLDDKSGNATNSRFVLGVTRRCRHFETRKVYVQTTSASNGSVESPRATLTCIAS